MSDGADSGPGAATNDDNFIAFAFAIMSIVALVLFLPQAFALVAAIFGKLLGRAPRKPRDSDDVPEDPIKDLIESAVYLPKVALQVVRNIPAVTFGASLLTQWPIARIVLPRFVSFVVRPRLIVLWLWVLLFFSAMYATLSYDPYQALGLPSKAPLTEVKRTYRALIKINHPDNNKTEAATVVYARVRKAYKAIVGGGDADDKKEEEQEFSVGIALPSFLTSHKHDTLILFGLLGLLFAVPIGLWYKYGRSQSTKLRESIATLLNRVEFVEPILMAAGQPPSAKFVQRRKELVEMARILQKLGLMPEGAINDTLFLQKFPSLSELRTRCLDPTRFRGALMQMGFDEGATERLKQYFEANPTPDLSCSETAPTRMPQAAYDCAEFLLTQYFASMNDILKEIESHAAAVFRAPSLALRSTRRIERHQEETIASLRAFASGRFCARDTTNLSECSAKLDELCREISSEIDAIYRRLMKEMQMEQMGGRRRGGGRGY